LRALVDAKTAGREVTAATAPQTAAPVIDLMEALKRSLAKQTASEKKQPLRVVPKTKEAAPRKKKAV
jgi:non-homologous end joining protein Ku